MITQAEIIRITGADVYGPDNKKIGTAGRVYLDNQSGEPEFMTVRTGLFGMKESLVPLVDAELADERLRVPYDQNRVKDAPRIDADGDLSPAEEELFRYYGGIMGTGTPGGGMERDGVLDDVPGTAVGRDTSGPTTDDAMTRSEERLVAGVRREQVGRVRLRKYVVTEEQQVTVPVSHEEVRIERQPITDANVDRAMAGPEISEEEHEVTLEAERPVVQTEAVPVERVRLTKETVSETETVGGQVRKEQIEVDDSDGTMNR